jgi:hypothetical protein
MQVPLSPILLFSYLRFAEAASFDKKELCRSDTTMIVCTSVVFSDMHST